MYRIVLACKGAPADVGAVAARDIAKEFPPRPWHKNVWCEWDGSRLILQADNDFDSNGLALHDEFSDAISASITDGFDCGIDIISVTPCRLTTPQTESMSEMAIYQQLRDSEAMSGHSLSSSAASSSNAYAPGFEMRAPRVRGWGDRQFLPTLRNCLSFASGVIPGRRSPSQPV